MVPVGINFSIKLLSDVCHIALLLVQLRLVHLSMDPLSCCVSQFILCLLRAFGYLTELLLLFGVHRHVVQMFGLCFFDLLALSSCELDFSCERC